MKTKFYVGMICLLSAGFAACSDDDDDDNGNGGGKTAQQAPLVAEAGIEFPVTDRDGDHYYYEDGRMVKATYGSYTWTFTSNPLSVTGIYSYDEGDKIMYKNIRTNGSGFMTYCEIEESEEEDDYRFNASLTYEYDGEGHIISEKVHGTDTDKAVYDINTTFTWENGNLVKTETVDSWKEDGETGKDVYSYEYTYNAEKFLNSGVFFVYEKGEFLYSDTFLFYAGMMGRPTRNIPTGWTEKGTDEHDYPYSNSYTVKSVNYNGDGSIKSIGYTYNNSTYASYCYYGYANYPVNRVRVSGKEAQNGPKSLRQRMQERKGRLNKQ